MGGVRRKAKLLTQAPENGGPNHEGRTNCGSWNSDFGFPLRVAAALVDPNPQRERALTKSGHMRETPVHPALLRRKASHNGPGGDNPQERLSGRESSETGRRRS